MKLPGRRDGAGPAASRGAMSRTCPRCQAKPGWRCTRKAANGGLVPLARPHPERREKT